MDDGELERRRATSREMWADGDYPTVARHLVPAAQRLVAASDATVDDRVLDVGTGSGSVALTAARQGATVLAIDQVDTWFDVVRRAVTDEGLAVELVVGEAEELPVADAAFDVVLSSFAHIFAPRHEVVAAEMARACRSGGVVACTAWARDEDDAAGRGAFAIVQRYLGSEPGPSGADWGDPNYLRETFAVHGVQMDVQRHAIAWRFPSVTAYEDFLLTASGPYRHIRDALRARGVWEQAWAEIRDLGRWVNQAGDGTYASDQEYLLAVGRRR